MTMDEAAYEARRIRRLGWFMLTALTCWALLGIRGHLPPAPLSADAPEDAFSAARAFDHIAFIGRRPHAAGSDAAYAVRDYIFEQVQALGVEVEVQTATLNWKPGRAATVKNVVARIPGYDSTGAVLLCAHYDSVAFGPGAADDGAGVAAMLEAMRALRHENLRNDVIFAFVDGEEGRIRGGTGLRGARAFIQLHRWRKDVAVVINFDARGTRGPSYMYETSDENGWLIKQLAQAGCHPTATSFMAALYRSMPVGSDFTAYLEAGARGYNCAFVDKLTHYHTALDNPENLSLASLQHHGEYALKLTRRLAARELAEIAEPDRVYFNVIGPKLFHYYEHWGRIFAGGALFLLALTFYAGRYRGLWTLRSALFHALRFLGVLLVLGLVSGGFVLVGLVARGEYLLYSSDAFMAMLLLGALLAALLLIRLVPYDDVPSLALGAALWWAALMAASFFTGFPGMSYYFTWPLVFALLGLWALIVRRPYEDNVRLWQVGLLALTALPGIGLGAGSLYGLYGCLTVLGAALLVPMLVLHLGLLTPHLRLVSRSSAWALPLVVGYAAATCLAIGLFAFSFSPERPKANCLTYGVDRGTGEAWWLSCDEEPDAWQAQFFGAGAARRPAHAFFPDVDTPYLTAPAPDIRVAPPQIELIREQVSTRTRRLRLRLFSPRGAPRFCVYADPNLRVLDASLDGLTLRPVTDGPWFLAYSIFPREGAELVLEVPPGTAVTLHAVDHTYALPDLAPLGYEPRPAWMVPRPNTIDMNMGALKSDETMAAKTYRF